MKSIWTMGEMLVEIMRPRAGMSHEIAGEYMGPYPSGAPAIFIDTAARLGIEAGIIGGIGKDGFGRNLWSRLERDGVNLELVEEREDRATAVAFVMYHEDGSRQFIYHIGGTPATSAVMPEKAVENVGFFHIMGCSLTADPGFCAEIIKTMKLMSTNGAKISFDPNIRPELLHGDLQKIIQPVMDCCSVLMPGEEELKLIAGAETVEASVEMLFQNQELEVILLKRGSKGCEVITRDDRVSIPALKIVQVDATGAGDCFDAAFLAGILQGRELIEAAQMASAAGALNAMVFGPMEGDISMDTIRAMLKK
jgi:Sugar kinases, ribokinase family